MTNQHLIPVSTNNANDENTSSESPELSCWQTQIIGTEPSYVAVGGMEVSEILSATLFRDRAGLPPRSPARDIAQDCHERWAKLADTLANLPVSTELLIITSSFSKHAESEVGMTILGIGRGETPEKAKHRCDQTCNLIWRLLLTHLDYLEIKPVSDNQHFFQRAIQFLEANYHLEISRRLESIKINSENYGSIEVKSPQTHFGFQLESPETNPPSSDNSNDNPEDIIVSHLFPWVPSYDDWQGLIETLKNEPQDCAIIVHLYSLEQAPDNARKEVRQALTDLEEALSLPSVIGNPILQGEAEALREEIVKRLTILQGSVLAGRVIIASDDDYPSPELLGTVKASLDDANTRNTYHPETVKFQGGANIFPSAAPYFPNLIEDPAVDFLFSPREASAILRTPLPTDIDRGSLPITKARKAPITGKSGDSCPLGMNIFRNTQSPVSLDEESRFRHTYMIGKTGTGKSTLLQRMICNDIQRDRGVAVLDPHGSLIESVLQHCPKNRIDDIILVDVTDREYPIGFNVLSLQESEPQAYRAARDLIIDDLYAYLDYAYNLHQTGGPIFESHFRGMLGLLMGVKPPKYPPNLMLFRALYTNPELRNQLYNEIKGKDLVLEDFVEEALNNKSENHSIQNVSSYITSKINRFISDEALRNIICQNNILDIDQIVNEGKVLLFYLGKGHVGDQAAGLLASQVVSRIRKAVMKRDHSSNHSPFYLYADEFQLFANDRFTEMLAEARKFGLAITMAHQYVEQLPKSNLQAILGNVGTTISLRVGAPDAEFLEPQFNPTFNKNDLLNLPNFQACVSSSGSLGHAPFSLNLLPPLQGGNTRISQAIRELSRLRYGTNSRIVSMEISKTYKNYSTAKKNETAKAR
ncbi:MAG: type IV secretory system conjugative DNA transfer family protein, partial [Halothece sp.]